MERTYQSEPRAQRWRALAKFPGGIESLIILGVSITQVRETFAKTWLDDDMFDPETRATCREIVVQSWQGAVDQGRWVTKGVLPFPKATAAA